MTILSDCSPPLKRHSCNLTGMTTLFGISLAASVDVVVLFFPPSLQASLLACEGLSGVCLVPTVASKKMMPKQSSKQVENGERGGAPDMLVRASPFSAVWCCTCASLFSVPDMLDDRAEKTGLGQGRLGFQIARFKFWAIVASILLSVCQGHRKESEKSRSRKEEETAEGSPPKKSLKKAGNLSLYGLVKIQPSKECLRSRQMMELKNRGYQLWKCVLPPTPILVSRAVTYFQEIST